MWQFTVAVLIEIHWNTVITIDVFLLLDSEIYLFWLIDWLIDWKSMWSKQDWVNVSGSQNISSTPAEKQSG